MAWPLDWQAAATCCFSAELFPEAPGAQARFIAGLMTGIGFIGEGAILKSACTARYGHADQHWITGAIGAAAAYERYEIALRLSFASYATLKLLTPQEA